MGIRYLIVILFSFALTSCIVQSPRYTSIENVMKLEPGMTRAQVEEILDLQPYDLKGSTDSTTTLIYIYRVNDRKTLSFATKPDNGRHSIGKYVQLEVTYSNDKKVISFQSCNLCPDNLVTTSKIDIEKIIAFVTVTLPVLLVYFGLQGN